MEDMLLLKSDGFLPLRKAGTIVLYGNGARKIIRDGASPDGVNERHPKSIEEGLEDAGFAIATKAWLSSYDERMSMARADFAAQIRREAKEHWMDSVIYAMGKEMPEPEYRFHLGAGSIPAVYVLSRTL